MDDAWEPFFRVIVIGVILAEVVMLPVAWIYNIDPQPILWGGVGVLSIALLTVPVARFMLHMENWIGPTRTGKWLLHLPHLVREHQCFCFPEPVEQAAPPPLPVAAEDGPPLPVATEDGGVAFEWAEEGDSDGDCVVVPRRGRHRSRSPYETRSRGTYQTRLRRHT